MKVTQVKRGLVLLALIITPLIFYFKKCRNFNQKFQLVSLSMKLEELERIYPNRKFSTIFSGENKIVYIDSPCAVSKLLFYSNGSRFESDNAEIGTPDPYGFIQILVSEKNEIRAYRMIGESHTFGDEVDLW